MTVFNQGDIVRFDFSPSQGHEPLGWRPGLVVSSTNFQICTSMALVCPITTADNGFPLHMRLPDSVDEVHGCVATEQVRALDLNVRGTELVVSLGAEDDFVLDVVNVVRSFL